MKNLKVSPLVRQFGSTFGFFRYRRREYFEVLLLFLSFRYGADLGRSRLVCYVFNEDSLKLHEVTIEHVIDILLKSSTKQLAVTEVSRSPSVITTAL